MNWPFFRNPEDNRSAMNCIQFIDDVPIFDRQRYWCFLASLPRAEQERKREWNKKGHECKH